MFYIEPGYHQRGRGVFNVDRYPLQRGRGLGGIFANLLRKDNAFAVDERNIQTLGIELSKVVEGLFPKIISSMLTLKDSGRYSDEN